jgi:hypothetical protein
VEWLIGSAGTVGGQLSGGARGKVGTVVSERADEPRPWGLLRTKLEVPRPRPAALLRTDLVEYLSAVATPGRLTLVVAGAGWGKSTLLASWVDRQPDADRYAWFSADDGDNDVVRYWAYVIAALTHDPPEARRIFGMKSGSAEAFHVAVVCHDTPPARRIRRSVSRLSSATMAWVQRVEPPLVECVDHIPHVAVADLQQRRDVTDGLALTRHHHHDRPPQPDRILRGPGDLLQLPALVHRQRPHEHTRSTSHPHHLPHWACRRQPGHVDQRDQLPGQRCVSSRQVRPGRNRAIPSDTGIPVRYSTRKKHCSGICRCMT